MKCPKCSTMFLAKPPPKKAAPEAAPSVTQDPFAAPVAPSAAFGAPSGVGATGVPTGQFPAAAIAAALTPQAQTGQFPAAAPSAAAPPPAAAFAPPAPPPMGFPPAAPPVGFPPSAAPPVGFPPPAAPLGRPAPFGTPATGAFPAAAPPTGAFPAPTGAFPAPTGAFPAANPAPLTAASAAFAPPPTSNAPPLPDPFSTSPQEKPSSGFDLVPNTYHPDDGEDAFGNDLGADVPGLHLDIDRGAEESKIKPLHNEKKKGKGSSPNGKKAVRALQSVAAAVFLGACIAGSAFLASLGAWGFGAPLESLLLPLMEETFAVSAPYSTLAENPSLAKAHQEQALAAQKRGDRVGELLYLRRAQPHKGSDDKTRARIRELIDELNAKGSLRGG